MAEITITIVDEQGCPGCGAGDEFCNRPKVSLDGTTWFWKCYNPECKVAYYNPDTRMVEFEGPLQPHAPYWRAGPHDCGATHNPKAMGCDDALEMQNVDDTMLRNAR